jgi:CHAD domain-containing protein
MKSTQTKKFSLQYWMQQVLKEADNASKELAPDPVHDLRVALRRCRSVGEVMQNLDPDRTWKKMRKAGKVLFSSLGTLRDCQVLMEWTTKIGPADVHVTQALFQHLTEQEKTLKQEVMQAFQQFDRKQWQSWAKYLPKRAARIRLGSEPFQELALEGWAGARRLQNGAIKTGSPAALHRLRIALKKFRYVVENFLPQLHEQWVDGLKEVQDMLGEIHDLDVLQETAESIGVLGNAGTHQQWIERIQVERQERLERYRGKTMGENSLWNVWRSGLPKGEQLHRAIFKKLETWASFRDSDLTHSRRVTRFAVQVQDGLTRAGVLDGIDHHGRELLEAAAILHDVGYAEGKKKHEKTTQRLIRRLQVPFGWKRRDLEMAALIAGYHRGALPGAGQKRFGSLPNAERQATRRLAGVLRFANAFDLNHDGAIGRIRIARSGDHIVIYAQGLNPASRLAEKIAGARYLLEVSCGLPIFVQPMPRTRRNTVRKPRPPAPAA